MCVCACGCVCGGGRGLRVGGDGGVGEGAGRIQASERVSGRCPAAIVCNMDASLLQRSRIRCDHTKTNKNYKNR